MLITAHKPATRACVFISRDPTAGVLVVEEAACFWVLPPVVLQFWVWVVLVCFWDQPLWFLLAFYVCSGSVYGKKHHSHGCARRVGRCTRHQPLARDSQVTRRSCLK
jgi:hypothetical protein